MLTLNDDGSAEIDFPTGAVKVKPPTFGGLKRLRAERTRLARQARDEIATWDNEHPAPEGALIEGSEEREPADRAAVANHVEDRVIAMEEINLDSTVAWWRLLLQGDDTFKGLAEGSVPDDVDDWPPSLLFDFRPVIPAGASVDVILSAQSMPDQWMRHVGKGRSRSGLTPATA